MAHNTLCEAFGDDYAERIEVDRTPIGSGCIAQVSLSSVDLVSVCLSICLSVCMCTHLIPPCPQVYRGTLTKEDGSKQDVAIKLIHPHVRAMIAVDMDIMRFVAYLIELFPSLEYLSMKEIVEEFAKVCRGGGER